MPIPPEQVLSSDIKEFKYLYPNRNWSSNIWFIIRLSSLLHGKLREFLRCVALFKAAVVQHRHIYNIYNIYVGDALVIHEEETNMSNVTKI